MHKLLIMKNLLKLNRETLLKLISNINLKEIELLAKKIKKYKNTKNKVIILGNGGSASICNHVSVDLSKNAGVRSTNFNEANLITCLSNDYGHENWMKAALSIHCKKKDLVILISSSGESPNIINASKWCIKEKVSLVTLTDLKKTIVS